NLPERINLLLHAADVIGHVPQQRPHRRVDCNYLRVLQLATHFHEWRNGIAQAQKIAAEHVETLDFRLDKLRAEHPVLDAFNLAMDGLQNRLVIVDDEVEDGVEDIIRSMR